MDFLYDDIFDNEYEDPASDMYYDDAMEADTADGKPSVWARIKNGFTAIINWFREKIQKFAKMVTDGARRIRAKLSLGLDKVKALFKKANGDQENAGTYLSQAKEVLEESKKEMKAANEILKEAKKGGDESEIEAAKQMRTVAKHNVDTAKGDLKAVKKWTNAQIKEGKQVDRQNRRDARNAAIDEKVAGYAAKADERRANRQAKRAARKAAAESYLLYGDEDVAVESALAMVEDPSLASAIDTMQTNIAINCDNIEACEAYYENINTEIDRFNRNMKILGIAAENLKDTGDKEAFASTTSSALESLQEAYASVGLESASDKFDEGCISQLRSFLVGAKAAIESQLNTLFDSEEYDEDDYAGESFLSSLVY